MPENDNNRRPLESIWNWRNRIKQRNKYGTYGGELNPSFVAADRLEQKPTGNWFQRIKKFMHPYGKSNYFEQVGQNNDLVGRLKYLDYADVDDIEHYVSELKRRPTYNVKLMEREKATDEYRGNYASSIFPNFRVSAGPGLSSTYFTYGSLSPTVETPGGKHSNSNDLFSQLWRWRSRKNGYTSQQNEVFSSRGTDIIDLNKNVIRLGPTTKQATALFNEFVEKDYPSVRPASDYQQGKVKTFGDMFKIPVENISLYAGIEDGHYKVDSLQNFNPQTTIYPARNIKRDILPIKKLIINAVDNNSNRTGYMSAIDQVERDINPWYYSFWDKKPNWGNYPSLQQDRQEFIHYRDSIANEIDKQLDLKNVKAAHELMYPNTPYFNYGEDSLKEEIEFYRNYNNSRRSPNTTYFPDGYIPPRLRQKTDALFNLKSRLEEFVKLGNGNKNYGYINTNDEERPISDWNASILDSKMVLADPNGGFMIGRIQDISKPQLDSLNSILEKRPMWLIRPDLGSFSQYRLDYPSLSKYLEQYYEHPRPEDPNVFTVGTTEPNKAFE